MSQEIELKLSLQHHALAALRRHPVIRDAPKQGNAVTLENTYYDTPELTLKARKIAVRTRRQGRQWLQTVKCAAQSTGGLTQRPEWEQPYDGSFDFSSIDTARVRKVLERHRDALVPVFSTRFKRETRIYAPDERCRILIMIDTGEVVCGEHVEPICEIELELDAGKPLDLLVLACRLAADLPLLPDDVSKAERGYRLHLGVRAEPERATESDIRAGQTPVEAFRQLAFSCARQWQANARGAAGSDDPEFIHQLRVSQRRLRSLIRLFAPALPDDFVTDWNERFKLNANRFGEARDLDVLYDEILAPVAGTSTAEDAALARLQSTVRTARDQAREATAHCLDPAAQGRLLIGFIAALHTLPSNNLIGAADLRVFAGLQLDAVRKKVRKRYKAARTLVPEHLHALRIALKQLRYGMEFFAPLMPARRSNDYTRHLTRAQKALGFIHDLDVARERLLEHAGDDPEMNAAAAFVCGWHGPRYARLCQRSIDELRTLVKGDAPWQ